MALVAPVFLDTSVLIGGLIELGPSTLNAQRIFDAIADGRLRSPHTAWHCCLEFYAVATRLPPQFRLSPGDTLRLIETEILGRCRVHQLTARRYRSFLNEAVRDRAAGGRIYDAHIADIAKRSGSRTVLTDNQRHFTVLLPYGIIVLTAEQAIAELGAS